MKALAIFLLTVFLAMPAAAALESPNPMTQGMIPEPARLENIRQQAPPRCGEPQAIIILVRDHNAAVVAIGVARIIQPC